MFPTLESVVGALCDTKDVFTKYLPVLHGVGAHVKAFLVEHLILRIHILPFSVGVEATILDLRVQRPEGRDPLGSKRHVFFELKEQTPKSKHLASASCLGVLSGDL